MFVEWTPPPTLASAVLGSVFSGVETGF
jgi:hypothetical protein